MSAPSLPPAVPCGRPLGEKVPFYCNGSVVPILTHEIPTDDDGRQIAAPMYRVYWKCTVCGHEVGR